MFLVLYHIYVIGFIFQYTDLYNAISNYSNLKQLTIIALCFQHVLTEIETEIIKTKKEIIMPLTLIIGI